MRKYVNIILSGIALVSVLVLTIDHFEYEGWYTIIFALIALGIGYWFGKWTCHIHKRQKGFWITIIVFVLLNLMHSMIDGASVGGLDSFSKGIAILSHEFARQPALYIILWGMLTPFTLSRQRFLIVPIAVTGIWFIGVYLGFEFFLHVSRADWLEPIADQAMFLFLGDIIHHLYEEYRKLRHTDTCCHV